MYTIKTELEISAGHRLNLNYDSPCSELHGHNWKIVLWIRGDVLNNNGMLVDFTFVKREIKERYDHRFLNDILSVNPTAENIAFDIANFLNHDAGILESAECFRVEVQETTGNLAIWES